MKKFYKKYINWIVIILIAMVGFKSCQSCSKSRIIEYNAIKNEECIKKLHDTMYIFSKEIDSLENIIALYKKDVEMLEGNNELLIETNRYYKETNNTLIKNKIINKR